MSLRVFQKGFNYSQDGPGNRLVIHLQGCNMRCPWCSNPEGMSDDSSECKTVSVEELESECMRCRPMFFDGGGVTLTGGEATLQIDAVKDLLRRLTQSGVHTAIETNAASKRLPELFPYLNMLIVDLKHVDDKIHKAITGVSNTVILENIKNAAKQGFPLLVRIPLIGGFNACTELIPGFVDFLSGILHARGELTAEFMPYHEYGREKWEKIGQPYTVTDGFAKAETLAAFEQAFLQAYIPLTKT